MGYRTVDEYATVLELPYPYPMSEDEEEVYAASNEVEHGVLDEKGYMPLELALNVGNPEAVVVG